eukprot:2738708-Pyramimonas_sp.AAC.1
MHRHEEGKIEEALEGVGPLEMLVDEEPNATAHRSVQRALHVVSTSDTWGPPRANNSRARHGYKLGALIIRPLCCPPPLIVRLNPYDAAPL